MPGPGAVTHGDTTPDVEKIRLERLRSMTGEERIAITFQLTNLMRRAAAGRIRAENPDWTEAQIKRELLRIAFLPAPLPPGLP